MTKRSKRTDKKRKRKSDESSFKEKEYLLDGKEDQEKLFNVGLLKGPEKDYDILMDDSAMLLLNRIMVNWLKAGSRRSPFDAPLRKRREEMTSCLMLAASSAGFKDFVWANLLASKSEELFEFSEQDLIAKLTGEINKLGPPFEKGVPYSQKANLDFLVDRGTRLSARKVSGFLVFKVEQPNRKLLDPLKELASEAYLLFTEEWLDRNCRLFYGHLLLPSTCCCHPPVV